MKAFIIANDYGQKFRPFTLTKPVSLLEIDGKSILSHQIDYITSKGISEVTIYISYMQDVIRQYVKRFPMNIQVQDYDLDKIKSHIDGQTYVAKDECLCFRTLHDAEEIHDVLLSCNDILSKHSNNVAHESAKISSTAVLENSSIGSECVIGDNVLIHNSTIMSGSIVGNSTIIKDSVVGWDCRIGHRCHIINRTLLSDDVVVDDDLVVNNTSVLPHKNITTYLLKPSIVL